MSVYRNNYPSKENSFKQVRLGSKVELTYQNWKEEYRSALSDFQDKKIVMLFTGGKDSSLILDYLQRASLEFGFKFQTHAADYPHSVFTDAEKVKLNRYWQKRGIDILWHNISESDELIEEALNDGKNPCHVCHKVKRKYLKAYVNNIKRDVEKEIVIILSYTLWDLVSYSMEYITGAIYADPNHSNIFQGKDAEARFTETSQRFYPLMKLNRGLAIFKPLLKHNDSEISAAVGRAGIPLSSVECKYVDYRPKRLLSRFYKKLGLHFDYDQLYSFAQRALGLRDVAYYKGLDANQFLEKLI